MFVQVLVDDLESSASQGFFNISISSSNANVTHVYGIMNGINYPCVLVAPDLYTCNLTIFGIYQMWAGIDTECGPEVHNLDQQRVVGGDMLLFLDDDSLIWNPE